VLAGAAAGAERFCWEGAACAPTGVTATSAAKAMEALERCALNVVFGAVIMPKQQEIGAPVPVEAAVGKPCPKGQVPRHVGTGFRSAAPILAAQTASLRD